MCESKRERERKKGEIVKQCGSKYLDALCMFGTNTNIHLRVWTRCSLNKRCQNKGMMITRTFTLAKNFFNEEIA